MKQGDFSESAAAIYDPATINAAGLRQPFAGNRIPSGRFDPVAVELLSYYPDPNQWGIANNYFTQAGTRTSGNNFSTKIDRRISDRQNVFGRFSTNITDLLYPNLFRNVGSPDQGAAGARSRSATLDDSYIVRGWVFHGNYGYVYFANPRDASSHDFNLASLGFRNSTSSRESSRAASRRWATAPNGSRATSSRGCDRLSAGYDPERAC